MDTSAGKRTSERALLSCGIYTSVRAQSVTLLRKSKMPIAQETYNKLFAKNWMIYGKQQFHSPKYVLEYLGRYTHKIAVSNYRIK